MSNSSDASDPYDGTFVNTGQTTINSLPNNNGNGNIMIGQDLQFNNQWENRMVVRAKDFIMQNPETGEEVNLSETIKGIQDRLSILDPDPRLLEEYAALRDAYEKYKVLEKLLMDKKNSLE